MSLFDYTGVAGEQAAVSRSLVTMESMDSSKQAVVYLGAGPVADEQCRWLEQAGLSVDQATDITRF